MITALILLAGSGSRLGTPTPKQFLTVRRKPLFIYTVEAFSSHSEVNNIVLVTQPDYFAEVHRQILEWNIGKVSLVTAGGDSRQESVRRGLNALSKTLKDDDIILIHDGARPLVSEQIITDNIAGVLDFDAVETALPSTNTIIVSHDGQLVEEVPERKSLFLVQTPQSFRYGLICKAHAQATKDKLTHMSDDAQLVKHLGVPVHIIKGDSLNFKITTYDDFTIFKAFIELREGGRHDH